MPARSCAATSEVELAFKSGDGSITDELSYFNASDYETVVKIETGVYIQSATDVRDYISMHAQNGVSGKEMSQYQTQIWMRLLALWKHAPWRRGKYWYHLRCELLLSTLTSSGTAKTLNDPQQQGGTSEIVPPGVELGMKAHAERFPIET
ncbi:uncharacterized protein EI90DRAFT_3020960 [Cantharellus anzutake]|uniref:uncharacterized protein n=1 Tax=Cantharellus anzutake TaxID=1750568 RepID=UPI001905FE2C|nr:uncharacterized protein EI90DRAFT_3020960 [Cantharellus anzutake]KAF8318577.1 hypothetical protein EI90DRAFT_3020960 [Cantharellus anzutake]